MRETTETTSIDRRRFLKGVGLTGVVVATPGLLAACGSSSKTSAATTTAAPTTTAAAATTAAPATTAAAGANLDALIAAAQKEGKVNLIATPDEWANYKGIIAGFKAKYKIDAPVANPEGSSADEITAVKTQAGQPGQPDAIDVGPSFGRDNKALLAPYKVSVWDDIPANMKDPDGAFAGAYYGVIAIGSNPKAAGGAPATFKELADPKYKGKFALNGDPRKAASGLNGVWAAALANGGSFDDISPGIEYFAKLKKDGILLPLDLTPAVWASGQASIGLDWSYNFPGLVPELAKSKIALTVNIPSDGVLGNYYVQGLVAGSPHQNAGKLWLEWLFGDEGALLYIDGGAFPARFPQLLKAGKVSDAQKALLPSADIMAKVSFPSADQVSKAKATIASDWGPKVGS